MEKLFLIRFTKFLMAFFTAGMFGLGGPVLLAEIALAIFAVLAVLDESKKIAVVEVAISFMAIIIFYHEPHLRLLCLSMAAFLAIWNMINLYQGVNKK